MQQLRKNNKIENLINAFYGLSILVQVLVLIKVIPYNWVNGGMSESYRAQALLSMFSIFIILMLAIFCRRILNSELKLKKWQNNVLYIIATLWFIGFIMQLVGTNFERYTLSLLLLLGAISHILLIRSFHKNLKP
jgi:uncharacterized membrane protein